MITPGQFGEARGLPAYGWELILATTAMNLLGLMLPLFLMQVYDRVIPQQAFQTLHVLTGAVVVAVVFEAILRTIRANLTGWMAAHFEHEVGRAAINRLLHARPQDIGRAEPGDLLQKMTSIGLVKEFYSGQMVTTFIDIPFALLFLFVIFYIAGPLAAVAIAVLVTHSLAVHLGARRLRRALQTQSAADDRRYNFLIELMGGIHTVKAMAMEAPMIRRYERLQQSSADAHLSVVRENADALDTSHAFSQLMTMAVVVAGGLLVVNEQLTVGGLAACTLLAGRAVQPLQRLALLWTRWQTVDIAKTRLQQIFDLPAPAQETLHPLPTVKGRVAVIGVTVGNPAGGPPILRDVSFSAAPGELLAITGGSGSGKSTLLAVIAALVIPDQGTVRLDGIDIASFDPASVRRQVALVPQTGVVFNGTITENLTMFRPELASQAMALSEAIGLDAIVARLPLGYETRIGDSAVDVQPRGVNQRIAIVRALVENPKIVLFDEANAALDGAGDLRLRSFVTSLRGKCTLIMVTQRPSWLRIADRCFELRDGVLASYDGQRRLSASTAT